jgi:hypothetical protein
MVSNSQNPQEPNTTMPEGVPHADIGLVTADTRSSIKKSYGFWAIVCISGIVILSVYYFLAPRLFPENSKQTQSVLNTGISNAAKTKESSSAGDALPSEIQFKRPRPAVKPSSPVFKSIDTKKL